VPKPVPSFQAIPLAAEPFKFAPEPVLQRLFGG
jgi:hypothetical protein